MFARCWIDGAGTLARGGLLLCKEVLVTGASGGVGHFAIQLAKLSGARVSALVGGTRAYENLYDPRCPCGDDSRTVLPISTNLRRRD